MFLKSEKRFGEWILVDFWNNNVLKNIPPQATAESDLPKIFNKPVPETIEAVDETYYVYERLKELKAQQKELESQIDKAEFQIKLAFGNNEMLSKNGQILVTYKLNNPSYTFDKKRFEKEQAELYNQYLIPAKRIRRLIIK